MDRTPSNVTAGICLKLVHLEIKKPPPFDRETPVCSKLTQKPPSLHRVCKDQPGHHDEVRCLAPCNPRTRLEPVGPHTPYHSSLSDGFLYQESSSSPPTSGNSTKNISSQSSVRSDHVPLLHTSRPSKGPSSVQRTTPRSWCLTSADSGTNRHGQWMWNCWMEQRDP